MRANGRIYFRERNEIWKKRERLRSKTREKTDGNPMAFMVLVLATALQVVPRGKCLQSWDAQRALTEQIK